MKTVSDVADGLREASRGPPHSEVYPTIAGALTPLRPGERVFFHHLASKSPWRTPGSAALEVPRRDNLVALVIEGLARSGPFRLHLGHTALEQATRATRAALAMPVVDGVVACQAGGTAS